MIARVRAHQRGGFLFDAGQPLLGDRRVARRALLLAQALPDRRQRVGLNVDALHRRANAGPDADGFGAGGSAALDAVHLAGRQIGCLRAGQGRRAVALPQPAQQHAQPLLLIRSLLLQLLVLTQFIAVAGAEQADQCSHRGAGAEAQGVAARAVSQLVRLQFDEGGGAGVFGRHGALAAAFHRAGQGGDADAALNPGARGHRLALVLEHEAFVVVVHSAAPGQAHAESGLGPGSGFSQPQADADRTADAALLAGARLIKALELRQQLRFRLRPRQLRPGRLAQQGQPLAQLRQRTARRRRARQRLHVQRQPRAFLDVQRRPRIAGRQRPPQAFHDGHRLGRHCVAARKDVQRLHPARPARALRLRLAIRFAFHRQQGLAQVLAPQTQLVVAEHHLAAPRRRRVFHAAFRRAPRAVERRGQALCRPRGRRFR